VEIPDSNTYEVCVPTLILGSPSISIPIPSSDPQASALEFGFLYHLHRSFGVDEDVGPQMGVD